jgi:hypothetical protein
MSGLFAQYAFNKTLEECYYQFKELGIDPKEGFKDYCYIVKKLDEQNLPYDSVLTEQVITESFFGRIFGKGENASRQFQTKTNPFNASLPPDQKEPHSLDSGNEKATLSGIVQSLKSLRTQFDSLKDNHTSTLFDDASKEHILKFSSVLANWEKGFTQKLNKFDQYASDPSKKLSFRTKSPTATANPATANPATANPATANPATATTPIAHKLPLPTVPKQPGQKMTAQQMKDRVNMGRKYPNDFELTLGDRNES